MTTSRADPIPFTCTDCGFHARLAPSYHGKAIRCPGCEAPQLVGLPAPRADFRPAPTGKVAFDCVACGHHADISADYAGKVVWCPGCNAVQIVPGLELPAPTTRTVDRAAETGFTCGTCGFHSRVMPSGINGVIYCLACRAPQSMTDSDSESEVLADIAQATRPAVANPPTSQSGVRGDDEDTAVSPGAAAAMIEPITPDEPLTPISDGLGEVPGSDDDLLTITDLLRDDEHASKASTATSQTDASAATPVSTTTSMSATPKPPPANEATTADEPPSAAATCERVTSAAADATPISVQASQVAHAPLAEARRRGSDASPGRGTVEVVQDGTRRVYRAVGSDESSGAVRKRAAAADDAASRQAEGKPGLLGRITGRFFGKK